RFERGGFERERGRELAYRAGLDRRKYRRDELADRFGVDDRAGDLIGLSRDKPAPDRVSLGPEVEALVVEALRIAVDHDAERHAVDAGAHDSLDLRGAGVDGDGVARG